MKYFTIVKLIATAIIIRLKNGWLEIMVVAAGDRRRPQTSTPRILKMAQKAKQPAKHAAKKQASAPAKKAAKKQASGKR